ncbi:MAG: DUF4238 domain-containing protein [Polyangiaceae bacterium]|nr:DUF4238 domain-containing protein [Polyangiaceae bacterium]
MTRATQNQRPRKQHYIPRFYLKGWAADAGGLWRYNLNPVGGLDEKQVGPGAVAHREYLYSVKSEVSYMPQTRPDQMETDFLAPLDEKAASALRKLITNPAEMSAEDREAWAQFLHSLRERHPNTLEVPTSEVEQYRTHATQQLRATCRDADSLARLDRTLEDINFEAMMHNGRRTVMARRIRDSAFVDRLLGLKWEILDAHPGYEFITGDPPALLYRDTSIQGFEQVQMLSVPLNPSKLLLMHPSDAPHWSPEGSEFRTLCETLVRFHNVVLLRNGCRTVFSHQRVADGPVIRLRYAVEESLRMRGSARNTLELDRE